MLRSLCVMRLELHGAGKGAPGQSAALQRDGRLRADSPAVLGPVARRATRCAHCVRCARTGATRQFTKRADARGHGPCVPRRLAGALRPARARLCGYGGGLQRKDSDVPPSSAFAAAVAVAVAWPCLCGSDCAVAVAAHTQLRASIAPALACGRRMSTKWLRGRRSPVGATSGAARSAGAGSARVSAPRDLTRRACSSAANASSRSELRGATPLRASQRSRRAAPTATA